MKHQTQLHEQQLLNVVADLCRFILREVVHVAGHFIHPEHELTTDKKYESLRHWEAQHLRAGSSSVNNQGQ